MSDKDLVDTLTDIDRAAGLTAPGGEVFGASDMPAGAPVGALQNEQQLAGMLSGVIVVSFTLLSKKRGPHWAMDEASASEAGAAYAAVIVKYFPGFSGGPELTAIAITAALVGPRVMQDKILEAQRQQEQGGDGAQS